ncbi:hypothetical protein [Brevibacillus agri]|uniref:hypothetical protein n=1 Tax=Brevibacillus agri TaxID=51101 RepID=UPI003D213AE5
MNESSKRRLVKLARRYLRAVKEYKLLKQLHDSRPALTDERFRKIEARMARLNQEVDHIEKEIKQIKLLRGEGEQHERDTP